MGGGRVSDDRPDCDPGRRRRDRAAGSAVGRRTGAGPQRRARGESDGERGRHVDYYAGRRRACQVSLGLPTIPIVLPRGKRHGRAEGFSRKWVIYDRAPHRERRGARVGCDPGAGRDPAREDVHSRFIVRGLGSASTEAPGAGEEEAPTATRLGTHHTPGNRDVTEELRTGKRGRGSPYRREWDRPP